MKLRSIFSAMVAALVGLIIGTGLIAFNRGSDVQPFALLFRAADKIALQLSEASAPPRSGPPTEYFSSIFTGLNGTVIEIPRENMPGAGGGVATLGIETLLVTFRGNIYAVSPNGDFARTAIEVPDNGLAAYREAAAKSPYDTFNHKFGRLRYNELEYTQGPQGRFLFTTYTEFHANDMCHTLTVARLSLQAGAVAGITAAPGDWEVVFRSQPCLPMRGVNAAIQGEEAAGRITFSADGTTAYLTVGEYGWNGWDSDGRTELSTRRLAQADDADQGKIVTIDLETLEARHFSKGHRNAQGIAIDAQGRVWAVEHGPRGGGRRAEPDRGRQQLRLAGGELRVGLQRSADPRRREHGLSHQLYRTGTRLAALCRDRRADHAVGAISPRLGERPASDQPERQHSVSHPA